MKTLPSLRPLAVRLTSYFVAIVLSTWCLGQSLPVVDMSAAALGSLLLVVGSPLLLAGRRLHMRRAGLFGAFLLMHILVVNPFSGRTPPLDVIAQFVIGFAFFLILVNLAEDLDLYARTVRVLLAATAAVAALLIYLHWFVYGAAYLTNHLSFETFWWAGRAGKNTLSFFLAVLFPFAYARFVNHRGICSALVAGLIGFAALYTISRMALLSVIATVVLGWRFGFHRRPYRRQLIAAVLVVFVVMPFLFDVNAWQTFLRLRNPAEIEAVEAGEVPFIELESDRYMFVLWSLEGVMSSPIVGRGVGSFYLEKGAETHNDYLKILYELGVVGLGLFVAILWFSFKDLRRCRRHTPIEHRWLVDGHAIASCVTAFALLTINAYDTLPVWFLLAGSQIVTRALQHRAGVMTKAAPAVAVPAGHTARPATA